MTTGIVSGAGLLTSIVMKEAKANKEDQGTDIHHLISCVFSIAVICAVGLLL